MSSSNIMNEILTTLSMDYAMQFALEMQKKERLKSSFDKNSGKKSSWDKHIEEK